MAHYGHPGVTNDFLTKTRHPRAMRYNDVTVLQNYNLAACLNLIAEEDLNFIFHMAQDQWEHIRVCLIRCILRMDLEKHFEELGVLKSKLAGEFPLPYQESPFDARLNLMAATLRMVDLGWACKPQASFQRSADAMMEELYIQGDLEKQLGVSVHPFADRDALHRPKAQLGYLVVVVQPFVSAYCVAVPAAARELIDEGFEVNRMALEARVQSDFQG